MGVSITNDAHGIQLHPQKIAYQVVYRNEFEFIPAVREILADGWAPQGGVSVSVVNSCPSFAQAFVKYFL